MSGGKRSPRASGCNLNAAFTVVGRGSSLALLLFMLLFLQAVRIAWDTIRVQKLKSFFTVIGVTIGVTFLIAVVSIVSGMGRYMKDDLVGKLIAVNSFNLRKQPDIQLGDVT